MKTSSVRSWRKKRFSREIKSRRKRKQGSLREKPKPKKIGRKFEKCGDHSREDFTNTAGTVIFGVNQRRAEQPERRGTR